MTLSTRDALHRSGVFQGLDEKELAKIEALCERREFADGTLIVQEDQKGGQVFLLLSGRVSIEVRSPFEAGRAQTIATLRSGELFGEVSLADGFLRSANTRAAEKCEVLSIDDGKLRAAMEDDPALGFKVMKNLARVLAARIRDTNMKLRNTLTEITNY
jgi:CRP/FNR family transcriptional regulator, cyclic AMP receptor protein